MTRYKHNDYYGYVNTIQQKAITNPSWFWGDTEDATQARQWLFDNGASAVVDDIYENTPEDIQRNIDRKKLATSTKQRMAEQSVRETMNDAAKTTFKVGAATFAAPYAISALANPVTYTTVIPKILKFTGDAMMPSTYIKGAASYLPQASSVSKFLTGTLAPLADTGALTLWTKESLDQTREGADKIKSGNYIGGTGELALGALGALPFIQAASKIPKSALKWFGSRVKTPSVSEGIGVPTIVPEIVTPEAVPSSTVKTLQATPEKPLEERVRDWVNRYFYNESSPAKERIIKHMRDYNDDAAIEDIINNKKIEISDQIMNMLNRDKVGWRSSPEQLEKGMTLFSSPDAVSRLLFPGRYPRSYKGKRLYSFEFGNSLFSNYLRSRQEDMIKLNIKSGIYEDLASKFPIKRVVDRNVIKQDGAEEMAKSLGIDFNTLTDMQKNRLADMAMMESPNARTELVWDPNTDLPKFVSKAEAPNYADFATNWKSKAKGNSYTVLDGDSGKITLNYYPSQNRFSIDAKTFAKESPYTIDKYGRIEKDTKRPWITHTFDPLGRFIVENNNLPTISNVNYPKIIINKVQNLIRDVSPTGTALTGGSGTSFIERFYNADGTRKAGVTVEDILGFDESIGANLSAKSLQGIFAAGATPGRRLRFSPVPLVTNYIAGNKAANTFNLSTRQGISDLLSRYNVDLPEIPDALGSRPRYQSPYVIFEKNGGRLKITK